jgi:hypothetical protein
MIHSRLEGENFNAETQCLLPSYCSIGCKICKGTWLEVPFDLARLFSYSSMNWKIFRARCRTWKFIARFVASSTPQRYVCAETNFNKWSVSKESKLTCHNAPLPSEDSVYFIFSNECTLQIEDYIYERFENCHKVVSYRYSYYLFVFNGIQNLEYLK